MKLFDYKGYSEEYLLDLCDDKKANRGSCQWKYWTSEIYSFGHHIRKYGYYPNFLPLNVYSEHGFTLLKDFQEHELNNNAYCMFCHSKKRTLQWKTISQKPCYTMMSPFVFYRRHNKIEQSPDAKGTLVFPAHSLPEIIDLSDVEEYINQLTALPEKFHPICVCLHMHDINKGIHKKYIEKGIAVYTAGNASDVRFAQRYYEVLKHFKYAMSNDLGSYVLYSVEMGIPFSIYGNKPEFLYKNSPHIEDGKLDVEKVYNNYDNVLKLFSGNPCIITEEQKKYAEEQTGINDCISRLKMAQILYFAYFKYFIKGGPIIAALENIKKYTFFLRNKLIKR